MELCYESNDSDAGCVAAKFRYTERFSSYELQASVAQLAEQLICNQQVVDSSSSASSVQTVFRLWIAAAGEVITRPGRREELGESHPLRVLISSRQGGFPSGQRGQTVNLMAMPSQVRILHPPLSTPPREEQSKSELSQQLSSLDGRSDRSLTTPTRLLSMKANAFSVACLMSRKPIELLAC